jgi:4-hydroxybenzoate polyprenyltransferase
MDDGTKKTAQEQRRLDFRHPIGHIGQTSERNPDVCAPSTPIVVDIHMSIPFLALLRPKHWIKNVVLFAPLVFSRELFSSAHSLTALRAFGAFCLAASCIYVINDIADVEADRAHPAKKNRPIASGQVSIPTAVVLLVVVLGVALALTAALPTEFQVLLGSYVVLNLAYSFRLKDVLLLDVMSIAAGFMLRVLGGAYAIGVEVSSWIVLCSLFISLFLGFAKRRGELRAFQAAGEDSPRFVLRLYSVDFLDQMLTVAAAGAVISYALYTVAPRTLETFGTDKLIYTTVFVLYGVFRYLYLTKTDERSENPTNLLTSDLPLILNGVLWILTCIALIYRVQ